MRSWHTKDGLPQNTVTAIVQTRDGYLWVGTGGGLARFDGVRFRTFGLRDGLGSVRIATLFEDRRGILWVGTTGGGVSRWENGRLTRLSEEGELSGADVVSLAADQDGTLWIGTRRGLLKWRDGEFTRMGAQAGLPEKVVRALLLDSTGTLWVSVTYEGLFRGTNGHFTPVPQTESTPSDTVASLLEDQDGSIWVGGSSGQVWQWRNSRWRLYNKTNGVPVGYLRTLVRGSHAGEVWVGSRNLGLAYFTNGTFQPPMVSNDFLEQPISTLCVDRDGAVWVGAGGGGLNRLSRRRSQYWGKSEGLPDSKVTSVAEDADGVLWVATETAGPWQFAGRRFTRLADPVISPNFPYYYSALSAGDGSIWMTGEGILLRFHKGQASQWYMIDELWHNPINALCEDGTNVWLGTANSSLFKCDGTALQMMATNGTFGGRIASLVREAPETFWIGCVGGLYRWDKGRVRRWTTQDGLLCADIQALHRDPDGTLWIGTLGGGLARLKDGRIVNITTRQGLIDDIIVQILPDDVGHLWLGCNHGIMRLERKELDNCADGKVGYLHAAVLGQDEGMLSEQCTGDHSPTALKTKDGRLLFPTTRGLLEIDPRRWEEPTAKMPQASIEEVLVDGRSQLRPGTTVLAPGVRRLELSYTAPSLQGVERVRFRYRLQPLDEDWINAGTRRTAYYTSLRPGRYVFNVTSSENERDWNEKAATLAITVQPHCWQTLWFQALAILGVCGGGLGWYLRRLSTLEQGRAAQESFTHQLLLSQENERKRVASELHDGLGQDLLLIKNRVGLLAADEKQSPEVARQLGEISQNASRAIADVRAISQALRPAALEQVGLTKAIEWMVDEVATATTTRFSAELENVDGLLKPEMEINLYRIVQEALNNVLKHAQALQVIVEIKRLPSELWVSVFDDGRGFELSHPGGNGEAKPGFGLVGMKERAKVLGGRIELQSTPGKGTRLTLRVPLLNE